MTAIELPTTTRPMTAIGQTFALLVDAYRHLAASRLFWITLVLSALAAGAFFFVGLSPNGVVLFFSVEFPAPYNSRLFSEASFYRLMFTVLAIPWWLGVFASALALVSVAGIFPDLLTGGAVELYVSKPLSRWRLFLTKYLGGLLFTAAQVTVFSLVAMLVMRVRGGVWEPGLLLAVPIVTLFFSYLFAICVLVGVLTRSTLAALLVTAIAWGGLGLLNFADYGLSLATTVQEHRLAEREQSVVQYQQIIDRNAALPPEQRSNVTQFEFQRDRQRESIGEQQRVVERLHWWQNLLNTVRTPLPKTGETLMLLDRALLEPDSIFRMRSSISDFRAERRARAGREDDRDESHRDWERPSLVSEARERIISRSLWWTIGSSMAFQVAILALAGWWFARRDF